MMNLSPIMNSFRRVIAVALSLGIVAIARAQQPAGPSTSSIAKSSTADATSASESTKLFESTDYLADKGSDSGCCDGLCDCCRNCNVYGYAEALFWSRVNRNSDQPVVILTQDANGNYPGPAVLTTGDLAGSDANPGMRVMLGWKRDCDSAIELTYFGLWDLNSSRTVTGADDLAIPGDLGLASLDFFAADRMVVTYRTQLNNFEVNYLHDIGCNNCPCCNCQWLVGFRYLNLEDQFNIQSTDVNTGTSNYHISTQNNLFGAQIGARIVRHCNRFGWDATGKVGLFGNAAEESQYVTDFPPGFFLRPPRSDSAGQVSMVADINVSAVYQLNCNWSVRAGYNVMWIEGVATAPDQLDFTDTPTSGSTVASNGGLFLHGANVGVEARW